MSKEKIGNMSHAQIMNKVKKTLSIRGKKTANKTKLKFVCNTWLNNSLGTLRTSAIAGNPKWVRNSWHITIHLNDSTKSKIGSMKIDENMEVVSHTAIKELKRLLKKQSKTISKHHSDEFTIKNHSLVYADSLVECMKLRDKSIDLLLTDPPYGISSPYSAEKQIPRRVRTNGGDFIMPKGEFGTWDHDFSPKKWTDIILPKIKGWTVIFCSHVQIKEYSDILSEHGFVAVGALVWHKTNPVPFNHKFKLLSAWESAVVGKRPSTKFNGKSVHNVFTYKSPSPHHRIHPTQKPLPLMEELIQLFTDKKDTVLDPFSGSATTTIASMIHDRKSLAFENNREYYDLSVDKIKNYYE